MLARFFLYFYGIAASSGRTASVLDTGGATSVFRLVRIATPYPAFLSGLSRIQPIVCHG